MITLKRAYVPASEADGTRILVERLWPRGLSKRELKVARWCKDAGPTTDLRKWFGHAPDKWSVFRRRYFRELDRHPETWRPILAAARRGRVTLVYSSRDVEHNNAVALEQYLRRMMRPRSKGRAAMRS